MIFIAYFIISIILAGSFAAHVRHRHRSIIDDSVQFEIATIFLMWPVWMLFKFSGMAYTRIAGGGDKKRY